MNTEILIIEDDPVIRKELQTVLEGNKYHTSVIEDFSDVTEQVRKINPHLILLDIKLPQENGFTICSGIRSFSQAPIIFVTSCNTDMDELNSIMLGGDAFITKPYHTAILLAKIASLLKRAYPDTQSRHLTYQGVHKDCTERLIQINPTLGLEVRQVLDRNKSERHIRGGIATREKYLLMHEKEGQK